MDGKLIPKTPNQIYLRRTPDRPGWFNAMWYSERQADSDVEYVREASAPDMASRIAELEAALRQTNKMIAAQIQEDDANSRPMRAEIWKMRITSNEQALAGAEGEA